MSKKAYNLILRVSGEWKNDLQKICKNKGRTMTGHIEHSFKIAKLVTEICGGNDDLDYVERCLREWRSHHRPSFPDIKPPFLVAADSEKGIKLPAPEKKVLYKKK